MKPKTTKAAANAELPAKLALFATLKHRHAALHAKYLAAIEAEIASTEKDILAVCEAADIDEFTGDGAKVVTIERDTESIDPAQFLKDLTAKERDNGVRCLKVLVTDVRKAFGSERFISITEHSITRKRTVKLA